MVYCPHCSTYWLPLDRSLMKEPFSLSEGMRCVFASWASWIRCSADEFKRAKCMTWTFTTAFFFLIIKLLKSVSWSRIQPIPILSYRRWYELPGMVMSLPALMGYRKFCLDKYPKVSTLAKLYSFLECESISGLFRHYFWPLSRSTTFQRLSQMRGHFFSCVFLNY